MGSTRSTNPSVYDHRLPYCRRMLIEELGDAARTLLRGRGRDIGDDLTPLARFHASSSSTELAESLAEASREDKPALGLLLARVALEEALSAGSKDLFSKFLFRFGAHLRTSVSRGGLSAGRRSALAIAAEQIFLALPSATSLQRSDMAAMRRRLEVSTDHDSDWQSVLGVTRREFESTVHTFEVELKGSRPPVPYQDVRPPRSTARREPRNAAREHPLPGWLSTSYSTPPDPLVVATANWTLTGNEVKASTSLGRAWSEFQERHYGVARAALDDVLSQVGELWGPTSSADALRTWNWIRLVTELAAIEHLEVTDVRRSWTSACGFAKRSLPDDEELIDGFFQHAIGDFVASDHASTRAWSAYTSRLVAEFGHEDALSLYTNKEKALLRSSWANHFKLTTEESRSTATATNTIVPAYKQCVQKLYLGARDGSAPARVLREVSHIFLAYLDESEGVIFSEAQELTQDVERLISDDGTTLTDLMELERELTQLLLTVRASGSSILQDYVAPLICVAELSIKKATKRLSDISRPEVQVSLSSSKLPFSAAAGSAFQIRFHVTNTGNTPAESVLLQVSEEDLGINATGRLDSLGPGATSELSVSVTATGESKRAVTLSCKTTWSDALLQQFEATLGLLAEDQKPAAWTSDDVNPYSLNTISEPERLVGRAEDLASLDSLLAGKASAYITGHKRVGKTSLTKILLDSVQSRRGWAGSILPLGRALGQDQTAGDLVYALLDEILDAAKNTYGRAMDHVSDVDVDSSGNFARAANRWLRNAARALPANARVIVAIDDFDELPAHLIKGPQADALFLFLRSLVDEPWLNLIVVGSEVLPSIIQAQAHKLNQVVPVSVTNFASRASTEELLTTPTVDRLEWLAEAIDRVHYLCAGNPYYETLVAQRLWLTMRERSRSIVTASDVDEAALALSREAPDSHFVHLWADSTNGIDHTSRPAVVASAVLRSIARCGGDGQTPAAPDEVIHLAQGWIQTATPEELLKTIAALKSREVVRASPSTDRIMISIPLVGVWLQGAGSNALDSVYAASNHATSTVRMITDSDLVELARQLRYKGEQITEIRIKAWLEQFGGNDRQYLAYKMLRRMILDGYFTSTRLQNTELPRLSKNIGQLGAARSLVREANNQNLKNAFLVAHGVPGDSTQGSLSLLAKALKIKKANIVSRADLADRIRAQSANVVLFLLDDYCGSGSHLSQELDLLLETISSMGEEWTDRVQVVVGASVVADAEDLPSTSGPVTVEGVAGTYLGDRHRPFSINSGVFDTAKEVQEAEEMTTSIGKALVPNNPLGFGGRALLTLFEFNCPNNVAPIFWKSGNVSGTKWTPLFERAT